MSAPRRHPTRVLALLWAVAASCVGIEDFFFAGRPASEYRFDEADPSMDGDLSDPHPTLVPRALREESFVALADGTPIHVVFARQPEGATRSTILFSHGNGRHLGQFWDRVEVLWSLGYQVMIYDYPGFGRSGGTASEPGMYAAAEVALAALASRDDVDPTRIVLYGHSLGAAATYELSVRAMRGEVVARSTSGEDFEVRPRALVSESAWCSIEEMIRDAAFLDVPRELLSELRFDNCARIAELRGVPVMMLHGERDRVVPLRQSELLEGRAVELPIVHRAADGTHVNLSVVGPPLATIPLVEGAPRPSERYADWLTSFVPPE